MILYCDGYTIGNNPSLTGGGFVVSDEKGNVLSQEELLRPMTCNEAELLGILRATELADYDSDIYTDSLCAFCWAKNGKCKARPDLSAKAKRCSEYIYTKRLYLHQIPREENVAGIYIEKVLCR